MKLIDFNDTKTYPKELKEYLEKQIVLKNIPIKEFRQKNIEDQTDVIRLLEDYFKDVTDICKQINSYVIIGYHITRVDDVELIRENGLIADKEYYLKTINNYLLKLELPEENYNHIIKKILDTYQARFETDKDVKQRVCFILNPKLFEYDIGDPFEKFSENIGGEIVEQSFKESEPDVFELFCNNGTPCIVKFQIPFNQIIDCYQDDIIRKMLYKLLSEKIWDLKIDFCAEGKTKSSINPEWILDITAI